MIVRLLIGLVEGYRRWISPWTPGACRYEPSCSRYAVLCLTYYSLPRAVWLSSCRICRCNPLFRGGLDFPELPPAAPAADREPDWQRLSELLDPPVPKP